VNRRCSYLTGGDNGTALAYGTAVAQDDRHVTVAPDGGGELLRLPVAYVDFRPLTDPHRYGEPPTLDGIRPQRTWISLDPPIEEHVRAEDDATVSKRWIAEVIGRLAWRPAAQASATLAIEAIRSIAATYHLIDLVQVAEADGLAEVGLRLLGVQARCPHGRVRLYLLDHGTGPMVVCRDVWFDGGDTATEER